MAVDEKKTAAASYILKFYNDVVSLNDYYAQYLNLALELSDRYGDTFDKASQEEKEIIARALQNVRFICHKIYVQYQSISKSLDLAKDKYIMGDYKEIKNRFVIDRELLERFTININTVLVESVIKNLLETSQDIVSGVFDNEPTNTP